MIERFVRDNVAGQKTRRMEDFEYGMHIINGVNIIKHLSELLFSIHHSFTSENKMFRKIIPHEKPNSVKVMNLYETA